MPRLFATRPGEMHHALSELVMRRLPNASLSAAMGVSKPLRDAAAGPSPSQST